MKTIDDEVIERILNMAKTSCVNIANMHLIKSQAHFKEKVTVEFIYSANIATEIEKFFQSISELQKKQELPSSQSHDASTPKTQPPK